MTESFTGVRKEYYSSGQLMSEVFVNDGVREGEYKSYYEDGQLYEIYNYINGQIQG
jgi:antitoxin component YwqK of YwqJK toxin-antitoxin module